MKSSRILRNLIKIIVIVKIRRPTHAILGKKISISSDNCLLLSHQMCFRDEKYIEDENTFIDA